LPARLRAGFTLVELLVVVAVLLILIVMTVTAIDFAFTSERVRAGARQIQSALEGARDRAIFAKEPRGLRLLVEQPNPSDSSDVRGRIVTSMIYIGAPSNWSEGQIRLERLDNNSDGVADTEDSNGNGSLDPGEDANGNGVLDTQQVKIVRGNDQCGWYALKQRGFLGLFEDRNLNGTLDPGEDVNGNGLLDLDAPRIKIPADDNGSWYTVLVHNSGPYNLTATNQVLELITPYRDPGTTPPSDVLAFGIGGPNTYILELPPRVLPEAQPILLPDGVCIDLDGSDVPSSWRPGDGAGRAVPYSSHMDILFSPRGVVTGPIAAFGLMHLYIAERKDVEALTTTVGVSPGGMRPPINSDPTSLQRIPARIVPGNNQFSPEQPVGHRAIVSIFTQTGKVSSFVLDATDNDNDGYADNPFRHATQGEITGQ
jgi:prepilin-type N-terminal cleavage/methylation domain-containing protein